MRILVLSFYFQPDLCAGSFRATSLINSLGAALPEGSRIDVMTTLPNRYRSFSAVAPQLENHGGLMIRRISLPAHAGGLADQSKAFLAFAKKVRTYVKSNDYDLVFATSSRLMTAALATWIARRKHARLYLDFRDIFADTIKDILPGFIAWVVKPAFSVLERWAVNRADKVNLISRGFAGYFKARYPRQLFSFFTNGIDDEFLAAATASATTKQKTPPFTVLYAGNIGKGQGLHSIVPELARKMGNRIRFRIIGDGGCKNILQKALKIANADNVELLPPVRRDQLLAAYQMADVLFLHLNDYDAFKKVLPSKIYEYAAMGKPVWAGVSGYAAEFARSEISNAAIFQPCNADKAMRVFDRLVLKDAPRPDFVAKYARSDIDKAMAQDILEVACHCGGQRDQHQTIK